MEQISEGGGQKTGQSWDFSSLPPQWLAPRWRLSLTEGRWVWRLDTRLERGGEARRDRRGAHVQVELQEVRPCMQVRVCAGRGVSTTRDPWSHAMFQHLAANKWARNTGRPPPNSEKKKEIIVLAESLPSFFSSTSVLQKVLPRQSSVPDRFERSYPCWFSCRAMSLFFSLKHAYVKLSFCLLIFFSLLCKVLFLPLYWDHLRPILSDLEYNQNVLSCVTLSSQHIN